MIKSASAEMSSTQAAGDRRSVSGILRALSGSRRVDGSGAPRLVTAVAAAVVLVLALGAGTAFASKGGDSFVGQTSAASGEAADGGLFNFPRDIAVNQDGTGGVAPGTVYVADQNNHRIQRLDADGDFELAWGRDVVTSGAPNDVDAASFEICDTTHPTTPNSVADCKAGTTASPALGGFLDSPSGVAVDQDNGDVYVADRRNFRVQQFDAHGNFVRAWGWDVIVDGSPSDPGNVSTFQVCTDAADCKAGTGGSGEGQFSANDALGRNNDWTLDVSPADGDPTTGKVVVADPGRGSSGNRRAQIFDLEDLAAETPPSAGDGEIVGGGSTGPFSSDSPRHVAIDSDGIVYAIDFATVSVQRYDTQEQLLLPAIIGKPAFEDTYPGGLPGGSFFLEALKVDPSTGNLLVTANPNSGSPDTLIYEFPSPAAESPTPTDFHMRGSGNQATNGLGVLNNGSLDRLYVSANGGAIGHRILILDEDGAQPAASADIEPASAVGAHEATLHGTVNPNGPTGFPTSYRFEYSEDGIQWTPASTFTNAGDGSLDIDASTTIGGLEANTFYRVRLVTERTFDAGSTVSPELTFLTDSPPPEVETGPVRHRTATTVQFTGQINPNNLATSYYFEYGPTDDFGFKAPIPDGSAGSDGVEKAIHEGIEGLEAATTYHYRLVATNAQGTTEGASRTFTTRAGATAPAGRAYEMVTPADKVSRRTGSDADPRFVATTLANPGTPAPDGDALLFGLSLGFVDSDAGTAFPHLVDTVVTRRGEDGWDAESVNDVVAAVPATTSLTSLQAMSADLETHAWHHRAELFPSGSVFGTKVFGDTGGIEGSGWYEWISDPGLAASLQSRSDEAALIADGGERMLRWGAYRGLLGPDDPSHPDYPDGGDPDHPADALTQFTGHSVYFQQPVGSGDRELVSECTGSGADATVLPDRDDNGTGIPNVGDDKIGFQSCEADSVTSFRGATVGAGGSASNGIGTYAFGPTARAMSDDGKRAFFMSPDPRTGGAKQVCETVARDANGDMIFDGPVPVLASGQYADCSPQLFVRQYGSSGEATVRWISQSEVARDHPDGQQFRLMDGGAIFQGASADGRYVFFKTKAPLVEGDPNGGGSPTPGGVTTGVASNSSWDVYRYELPVSVDSDPDEGELMRISGGPSGVEDPNTNSSNGGNGSSVRYVSEDGNRAYFVTGAPIGDTGATWNQPPSGGATVPGGTVSNSSTRNLYLYDENETGDDRWRFVAQIPFAPESTGLTDVANCASAGSVSGRAEAISASGHNEPVRQAVNCVRGTPDGSKIVFETPAQLTEDDTDSAADIYLYDADAGELTRISAPPLGATPYGCDHDGSSGEVKGVCNADLGFPGPPGSPRSPQGQEAVGTGGRYQDNLAIDASGELSVFFESRVPLVAQDTNGDRMDTYQWRAGELSLISPGDSDHDAWYSGNSADGRDVFFFTSQRISPWEIDQADFDLYDARVGGGFAPPPPRPAGCDALADGCQSAGDGSPTAVSPRTTTGAPGAGNASPGERVRLRAAAPGRKALRRAARTGVVRIRVRSSAPGTVRALARARLRLRGGKRAVRVVARGRVRVRKAGRRVVALRLNHRARRELARGRGLRLVVRVGQPGARPTAVRMGLRRAGR